jgi:predicted cytidylate kinase
LGAKTKKSGCKRRLKLVFKYTIRASYVRVKCPKQAGPHTYFKYFAKIKSTRKITFALFFDEAFYTKHTMLLPSGTKITLTGDLGSGKSAVSKILCTQTGYEYVSTGRIQRQLAAEMGLDTLEMNRRADTDPSIDQRIDGIFIELGKNPNGYVIDSRMAWFFLPDSFKVYLQTEVGVAVDRILADPTRKSEEYANRSEAIEKILARKQSENARFLLKYGADCSNLLNFDLVIDTNKRNPEQVANLILSAAKWKAQKVPFARFW